MVDMSNEQSRSIGSLKPGMKVNWDAAMASKLHPYLCHPLHDPFGLSWFLGLK